MRTRSISAVREALANRIDSGDLAPGVQLPTHRQLAVQFGIAVASATKVYAQLQASGHVVGEIGRGTFVRARRSEVAWDPENEARSTSKAIDLSFNHPTLPGQEAMVRHMLHELAASAEAKSLLHQQPPGGRARERQIMGEFLSDQRGVECAVGRTFLVGGAQQGLDVIARAVLGPHDRVAVDALTYPGFKMLAKSHGLELMPVACAVTGTDLDALDALCGRSRVRAVYAMPTMHNPLSWVMSELNRRRLVDIARRHDVLIIEDASYSFLVEDAPEPLARLAPERTFYVTSLSKGLGTGLRLGAIVSPSRFKDRVISAIRASYWSLPSIVAEMGARWIEDGTLRCVERDLVEHARRRQLIAAEVFRGMNTVTGPTSMCLWMPLPEGLRMDRVAAALAERSVAVSKASAYAATRQAPHALRIGLSSAESDGLLREALMKVRETVESFPI